MFALLMPIKAEMAFLSVNHGSKTILTRYYNRTAIGMVQPGEYYMITAGTAQYKNGLSFAELQSIFANLGCTYARSMDGGGSSSLVVNGKLLNTPAQYDERPVVDFLSFLP